MIYLDSAATSCPKPPEVVEAVRRTLVEVCANPGRGAYDDALEAGRVRLRRSAAAPNLIGHPHGPLRVCRIGVGLFGGAARTGHDVAGQIVDHRFQRSRA